MTVNLIWLAPDISSLSYNNSLDILRRLASALRKQKLSINILIYIYTLDRFQALTTIYEDIPLKYISSPAQIFDLSSHDDFHLIFLDSYRLPDRLSLLFFEFRKTSNIKTFYIQHGRYTKLNRRVINKHVLLKSFFYSIFLFRTFLNLPISTLKIVLWRIPVIADFAFIYSPLAYWIDFHLMQGLMFESNFLILDRDMTRFSLESVSDSVLRTKNSFLYIAQTLVEDGRCSKSRFFAFWEVYTYIYLSYFVT